MRRDITRRRRYRPFSLVALYERVTARELSLKPEEINRLVEDELSFLADTHASVTYSLFERARRQALCTQIQGKLSAPQDAVVGQFAGLTNAEAGFVAGLKAEFERRVDIRANGLSEGAARGRSHEELNDGGV
ncbi:hypothetical protein [Paraburkholderia fungorum]|jgi:hypothetical protein|uniref:Uncharacterized protein n=1 Tax=Paraburkholderia fungorum TaxID=134537 RepID=A0AAW3V3K5_9BURK|nr:hypothetical protein [Paraburkholderia fungorum]AJZ56318.1 hypothetical protein OI25_8142 [Paraburkholderia fungorum]MBB4516444.1 hypothetical protein [Paraburkholderia fungorum]MBB5545299.1 hypothetical protein [Paraburkholderia fungorum]MBB6205083.1 hypothetical protein [Paraburkholderia fungorum]MBU7440690.1 hypothetical protein [Paraburkholderia fungorum]